MYDWRRMTPAQRQSTTDSRNTKHRPWHSPPHRFYPGTRSYLLTAANFEHRHFLGFSPDRLDNFSDELLATCAPFSPKIYAWCILPNHYHIALQTADLKPLLAKIAQLHGRTSRYWNLAEQTTGRQVWFNCVDREMRSHRHLLATINYVHHNPVRHGYVQRWPDWPWSSAARFLQEMGRPYAEQMWRQYPLDDYGKGWDD